MSQTTRSSVPEPQPRRDMLHTLKVIAAVMVGAILGVAMWTVGEVVIHGPCGVPFIQGLWCNDISPLRATEELGLADVLGFVLFVGLGIGVMWGASVEGGRLLQ